MTFDNSRTIISFRIRLFILTVIFLAYLILAYPAEMINFPVFGMQDTTLTIIFSITWILVALYPAIINYYFIFFSDDNEKIILRYFSAGIFGGKKNSIEIDKREFAGYKTETSFFGLIVSLILFQKFNEGVAKYPPIYISALSGKEKSKLLNRLSSYVQS